MITKSWAKIIKSLQIKKYRDKEGMFIVQGYKSILELLHSNWSVKMLCCTEDFYAENQSLIDESASERLIVKQKELESLGTFKSNNSGLAVVEKKENDPVKKVGNEWVLVLDNINDPGNMGTLIRIADWYGITKLITSSTSVDLYNPKVITASMASFLRVSVFYTDLSEFFQDQKDHEKILGAYLDGKSIYQFDNKKNGGYLVLGNESHGIDDKLEDYITDKISIPRVGQAESLNVSVSAGILLDNLFRP